MVLDFLSTYVECENNTKILKKKNHLAEMSDLPNISTLQSWLDQFERLWTEQKNDAEIRKMAERLFNLLKHNVLELSLFFMENNQEYFRKKADSWTKVVLKRFLDMRESLPKQEKDRFVMCLNHEMQKKALYLATCGHYNILIIVCRLFHLNCENNQHLTGYLNVMISRQQFKEASRCITELNLQPYFTIHQVIVPLVLQDKLNLVEAYCRNYKKLQIELLQFLDQFCAQSFDVSAFVSKLDITGIKKDKLSPRVMRKLIARLLAMYQLESKPFPNYDKTKNMGALKYLLFKRYNEPASCSSNWDEFVEQAVGTSQILEDELIMQFICYNDLQAAVKWSKKLNVSRERMPEQVLQAIDGAESTTEEEDWDACYKAEEAIARSNIDYYQLSLSPDKIIVVDHEFMLDQCIQQLTKPDSIIGIDMEWKPSFLSTATKVSLVQLACYTHIYLIDVPALEENPDCLIWLMDALLCNEDILKLGYGINHDLQMLVKSYPYLKDCVNKTTRLNDLSALQSKLEAKKSDIFGPLMSECLEKGLSGLVNRCFGQQLDKKEQMSNWEMRPLSTSQVIYAALDAYCLLEVFEYMKMKVESAGIVIDLECGNTMKTPTLKKAKPKRNKKRDKEKAVMAVSSLANLSLSNDRNKEPISPSDLAVVCDTMLQGLGKQLRSCGVDVKILENDQDHYQAVQIARAEGRIILTRGTPYLSLRAQIGDDRCYLVKCNTAFEQLEEVINFYNVHVTTKHIFSRCQACNGNTYAKVPSSTLKEAYVKKNSKRLQQHMRHGPAEFASYSDSYGFEDDFDEDEFFFDTDVVTCHEAANYYTVTPSEDLTKPSPKTEKIKDSSDVLYTSNYKEGAVYSSDGIDMDNLTVGDGIEVQMDILQDSILSNVDMFFICTTCGKIYWEGKHWSNVLDQYSHILHREPDKQGGDVISPEEEIEIWD